MPSPHLATQTTFVLFPFAPDARGVFNRRGRLRRWRVRRACTIAGWECRAPSAAEAELLDGEICLVCKPTAHGKHRKPKIYLTFYGLGILELTTHWCYGTQSFTSDIAKTIRKNHNDRYGIRNRRDHPVTKDILSFQAAFRTSFGRLRAERITRRVQRYPLPSHIHTCFVVNDDLRGLQGTKKQQQMLALLYPEAFIPKGKLNSRLERKHLKAIKQLLQGPALANLRHKHIPTSISLPSGEFVRAAATDQASILSDTSSHQHVHGSLPVKDLFHRTARRTHLSSSASDTIVEHLDAFSHRIRAPRRLRWPSRILSRLRSRAFMTTLRRYYAPAQYVAWSRTSTASQSVAQALESLLTTACALRYKGQHSDARLDEEASHVRLTMAVMFSVFLATAVLLADRLIRSFADMFWDQSSNLMPLVVVSILFLLTAMSALGFAKRHMRQTQTVES